MRKFQKVSPKIEFKRILKGTNGIVGIHFKQKQDVDNVFALHSKRSAKHLTPLEF